METMLERALRFELQRAQAKIAELERSLVASSAPRKQPQPRLSPAALRQHYERSAARARLARANRPEARRRCLQRALALGAIPADFDGVAYLAGRPYRSISCKPPTQDRSSTTIASSTALADATHFIALRPNDIPNAAHGPERISLWIGFRLAHVDGGLTPDQLAQLGRLLSSPPSIVSAFYPPLPDRYDDGITPTHSLLLPSCLCFPNGRVVLAGDTHFYPSGRRALCLRTGDAWYPHGQPMIEGDDWWTPGGLRGDIERLMLRIAFAAGPGLAHQITSGLQALPLYCKRLAILELAWTLLRGT